MEARLARPDLRVTVSKEDAHPGIHGAYINACSLFAILTGESPVGLPANLKIPGRDKDLAIAPDDAKYLQELAWKVYQRELKHTRSGEVGGRGGAGRGGAGSGETRGRGVRIRPSPPGLHGVESVRTRRRLSGKRKGPARPSRRALL